MKPLVLPLLLAALPLAQASLLDDSAPLTLDRRLLLISADAGVEIEAEGELL